MKLWAIVIFLLTLVGMPLFAVMGGISILSWLGSDLPDQRFVRFIAANVLEDRFSNTPILATIPLFTFVGYLMAESKTPDRIVRAASAVLGWMPGGLAIVCTVASAFFATLTGGSGVTIVAIGGLLYPALRRQGYSEKFTLGLVTTAGAMGLLFFPSPLVMIYAFVAGVDVTRAYKATLPPGLLLMVLLCGYAFYEGKRSGIPRSKFDLKEAGSAVWAVKWELATPLLVGLGLATGLMELDESAGAAVIYTLIVEVFVYKDLTLRKVVKVARDAMTLSGAIILILAMATAMTNYIIQERIPQAILEWFTARGMTEAWQFILVLNLFVFVLAMLMEPFGALLVAIPLLIPLAATFHINPFHLAVMFLLNLEIAYVTPPMGLNLFIASFRFSRPIVDVYRVVLPFVAVLTIGLGVVIVMPSMSSFTIAGDVAHARAQAAKDGVAPREAWLLECVQEDTNNLKPCSKEDIAKWGADGQGIAAAKQPETPKPKGDVIPAVDSGADAGADAGADEMDALLKEMLGGGADAGAPDAEAPKAADEMDDLLKEMLEAGKDGG
ncbi:TRAP transporter large permease [Polyangium jinanense]|uniref:TRAP transporter large permease n=1 Tax=Polyangium jinanense TaxID=2829994 RepID=A0A9X3X3Q1_9BACT|nr:TRAP transporter large permease [Polyangium jinanense]MDC3958119.1 TRAP transporter large permease [Polyangium jinanense]MDC3983682.1 TRAP transporter large permease [Polyangium jinanense]